MTFTKGILTFTPVSENRLRIIKFDRITLFHVYATSEKMLESRNSIAHLQHEGISALSATSEWHIISKQRGGILLITRNHCVIIIRQNLKLFSPTVLYHPPCTGCIIQFAVIDESIKPHTECSAEASTRWIL